jgi:putative oxidoreductase
MHFSGAGTKAQGAGFHILATDPAMLGARCKTAEEFMGWQDRLYRLAPYVLSIVRIVVALLFFEHGTSKMVGFPIGPVRELFTLSWYSGAIEFAAGALLIVGLATRTTAFIASGEMAFAYFLAHAPQSFFPILNRGDAAILYCFIFFYLVFAGGGPWSLDAWLKCRRASKGNLSAGTRGA